MKKTFQKRKKTHKSRSRALGDDGEFEEEDFSRDLPRWDMTALYSGLDSKDLAQDKAEAERLSRKFQEDYKGKVANLGGAGLAGAVAAYEDIEERLHAVSCYCALLDADDVSKLSRTADLKKWHTEIAELTRFFKREISQIKEQDMMMRLVDPELAQYAPWVAKVRADSRVPLPDDVEAMSQDYSSANRDVWTRFYHETLSSITIDEDGKRVPFEKADDVAIGLDELPEAKTAARKKIAAALRQKGDRFALIYNTIARDDMVEAQIRGRSRPDEGMNIENGIDTPTADVMFSTIKASYAGLSHRFYSWKAAQQGVAALDHIKINAPMPFAPPEAEETYSFDGARRTVLRAFKRFSPRFYRLAQKFFDEEHVDAILRPNKEQGAFSLPAGPASLPFILLNYGGGIDDVVSTLGHELGHGIHQALSERAVGFFLSDATTVVSETASLFAEQLVFDELVRGAKDPDLRRKLQCDRVEGMLLNGLQQLSYYDFERRVHNERKSGELSFEQISDIWVETQKEYYGPSVVLDDYDRYFWVLVPHFFESPFYVYSYSFAQQMVGGLYQAYHAAEEKGFEAREEFVEKYTEFLEAGMSRNLHDLLQPFGLDPEKPEFWKAGVAMMEKHLEDLIRPDRPSPRALPAAPKPSALPSPPPAGP